MSFLRANVEPKCYDKGGSYSLNKHRQERVGDMTKKGKGLTSNYLMMVYDFRRALSVKTIHSYNLLDSVLSFSVLLL